MNGQSSEASPSAKKGILVVLAVFAFAVLVAFGLIAALGLLHGAGDQVGRVAERVNDQGLSEDDALAYQDDKEAVEAELLNSADSAPAAAALGTKTGREPQWATGLHLQLAPAFANGATELRDDRRARFVALHVPRGEFVSPFLPAGVYRATWRGELQISARDRFTFIARGKGAFRMEIDGEAVLDGRLRPGAPLEGKPLRLKKGPHQVVAVYTPDPLGDAEVRLGWSSRQFAEEPIDTALWRHDAGLSELGRATLRRTGRALFASHRCATCHDGFGEASGRMIETTLDGPDLTGVGERLHGGWIARWIDDPRALRADARMPDVHFSSAEDGAQSDEERTQAAADVAAWLIASGSKAASGLVEGDAERGESLFRELGCAACHVPPGAEDVATVTRAVPWQRHALGAVATKWRPQALVEFLQAPAAHHEAIRMPDFQLTFEESRALAAWLLEVSAASSNRAADDELPQGDASRGAELAKAAGCAACHTVPGLDAPKPDRPLLQAAKAATSNLASGCLSADESSRGAAPGFAFTAAERDALLAFLTDAASAGESMQRSVVLEFAARQIEERRCTACHGWENEKSVWARVVDARYDANPEELIPSEEDPVAQGVPALTHAGAKLLPSWMTRFVAGGDGRESPRPWIAARMPVFKGIGSSIVQGLLQQHGYPTSDPRPVVTDDVMAGYGRQFASESGGVGCTTCHGVGDREPTQVFERQGINFMLTRERLRHEYFTRWLLDPTRIDPDSRMPKYADAKGRTGIRSVLNGEAARQFEAVWQWLQAGREVR